MNNKDLIAQLDALTETADALRQDLARSDDMPALAMAPALVRAVKLNADFHKLARAARKQLAPLYGKPPDDDQAGPAPAPRPRKK